MFLSAAKDQADLVVNIVSIQWSLLLIVWVHYGIDVSINCYLSATNPDVCFGLLMVVVQSF